MTAPDPGPEPPRRLDQRVHRHRRQDHGEGRGHGEPVVHTAAPGPGHRRHRRRGNMASCCQATASGVLASRQATRQPAARRTAAAWSVSLRCRGLPGAAARTGRRRCPVPRPGPARSGPWPLQVDTSSSSGDRAGRRRGGSRRAAGPRPRKAARSPRRSARSRRGARRAPGVRSRLRDGLITASELSSTSSKTPAAVSAPVSVISWPSRPSLGEVHADGGGGADRELERRGRPGARVRAAPGVEQQQHPVPPVLLLAAHHRARRSARSSASAPGAAHRRPGRRAGRRRPRPRRPRCGPGRRPSPSQLPVTTARGSGTTLGVTTNVVREENDRPELDQAERVRDPDLQRADHELAPQVRAQRVAQLAGPAALDAVQDVPGPGAQRVGDRVLGQQQPGGQPGDVLQLQPHLRGLARPRPGAG